MLHISTTGLAFVPSKSYQFYKPIRIARSPHGSASISILYGTPTRTWYIRG